MGNTAYGLPSRVLNEPEKTLVIPHKGIDCVSLQVNGKHVVHSCYHHAPMMTAILQDGDESIEVTQWGLRKEFAKGVVCCVK